MSSEPVRGEGPDSGGDIYSVGTVRYEMATRRRPFEAKSSTTLIDDILHKIPQSPSPRLRKVVVKWLEKERDDRYQSAKELAVDLRPTGKSRPRFRGHFNRKTSKLATPFLIRRKLVIVGLIALLALM